MATLASMHVDLLADTSEFQEQMANAGERFQRMGSKLTDVGKSMSAKVTAPIVAAGAAALASAVKVGNYADRLLDLQQMTGLTTDEIQRFRGVAIQAGVSTDIVTDSITRMQVRMSTGAEGSADLRLALDSLGISMTTTTGATRPMGEIVTEALGKLGDMEDVTQRNVTAIRLFGRSATELAPILGLGSDAIEDAMNRTDELGIVMSGPAIEGANAFRIEWDFMKATFGGVVREVGMAVMPVMLSLVGLLNGSLLPVIRSVVGWFDSWPPGLKQNVAVVAALVAGIGPLLIVLGTLISVGGTVVTAVGAIGSVMTGIGPIIALVVTGVGALTAAWMLWGDEIMAVLKAVWSTLEPIFSGMGTVLKVTAKIVLTSADIIVGMAFSAMMDGARNVATAWNVLAGATKKVFSFVAELAETLWENIREFLLIAFRPIVEGVLKLLEVIQRSWAWLKEKVTGETVPRMSSELRMLFDRIGRDTTSSSQRTVASVADSFGQLPDVTIPPMTAAADGVISEATRMQVETTAKVDAMMAGLEQRTFEGTEHMAGSFATVGTEIPETLEAMSGDSQAVMDDMSTGMVASTAGLATDIGNNFNAMVSNIEDVIGPLPSSVQKTFKAVHGAIEIVDVASKLKGWADFAKGFVDILTSIWSDVKDIVGGIADAFRDFDRGGVGFGEPGAGHGLGGSGQGADNLSLGPAPGLGAGQVWGGMPGLLNEIMKHTQVLPGAALTWLSSMGGSLASIALHTNTISANSAQILDRLRAMAGGVSSAGTVTGGSMMAGAAAGGGRAINVNVQFLGDVRAGDPDALGQVVGRAVAEQLDRFLGDREDVERTTRGTVRVV